MLFPLSPASLSVSIGTLAIFMLLYIIGLWSCHLFTNIQITLLWEYNLTKSWWNNDPRHQFHICKSIDSPPTLSLIVSYNRIMIMFKWKQCNCYLDPIWFWVILPLYPFYFSALLTLSLLLRMCCVQIIPSKANSFPQRHPPVEDQMFRLSHFWTLVLHLTWPKEYRPHKRVFLLIFIYYSHLKVLNNMDNQH